MSFNVRRMSWGVTTAGSNSTSACSCVRLTATLWTPGNRPSAFSIVPVQSEQCSPLILARNRDRPPGARPSSTQYGLYGVDAVGSIVTRSEEHTSELQSRPHLVCRLLLENKHLY